MPDGKGVDWSLFPIRGAIIFFTHVFIMFAAIVGFVALVSTGRTVLGWLLLPLFGLYFWTVHLEARARQFQARVDAETKARTHHKCTPDCR